jgi:hypothetical protein
MERLDARHAFDDRNDVLIVRTDEPIKQVFEAFAACVETGAPLLVAAVHDSFREGVSAKANDLLAYAQLDSRAQDRKSV